MILYHSDKALDIIKIKLLLDKLFVLKISKNLYLNWFNYRINDYFLFFKLRD